MTARGADGSWRGALRRGARRTIERALGARLLRPPLPRGLDLFADLADQLPRKRFDVVFDVGANDGRTALVFAAAWPGARIHAFEPSSETFARLSAATAASPEIAAHRLALGAREGPGWIETGGLDRTRRAGTGADVAAGREPVEMTTLDAVRRRLGVARIDYLKIDVEGGDLDVLAGAQALFAAGAIDIVQIEVGMNPDNTTHVPFGVVVDELAARGFLVFGLYNQSRAWPDDRPHLRRADAVFLAERLG